MARTAGMPVPQGSPDPGGRNGCLGVCHASDCETAGDLSALIPRLNTSEGAAVPAYSGRTQMVSVVEGANASHHPA